MKSLGYAVLARTCLSALALLLAASCGKARPETAKVWGHVTIDGQPVPKGSITFSPAQGPVTGAPIANGKFHCQRVPLGGHTVSFNAAAAEMREILDVAGETSRQVPRDILPARYRLGVPAEVHPGENQIDFDLTTQDLP